MPRSVAFVILLIVTASLALALADEYPALTRTTLVGAWEAAPPERGRPRYVLHFEFAARDADSYLAQVFTESAGATRFRLGSCQISGATVKLHFRCIESGLEHHTYWFEGQGYGDDRHGHIEGKFGVDDSPRGTAQACWLEKGTWTRELGDASIRAAAEIELARRTK